jgi:hypothetical protein
MVVEMYQQKVIPWLIMDEFEIYCVYVLSQ